MYLVSTYIQLGEMSCVNKSKELKLVQCVTIYIYIQCGGVSSVDIYTLLVFIWPIYIYIYIYIYYKEGYYVYMYIFPV